MLTGMGIPWGQISFVCLCANNNLLVQYLKMQSALLMSMIPAH